jgi:SAM-dependent methyltransferase
MSFLVAAEAYDRFMGRYSVPLAGEFADFAGLDGRRSVLDVGCGTGALTAVLVRELGEDAVSAVDPSEPFVAAARRRYPGVSVQQASAEELPFADRTFDAALAQLVVHFMTDPLAGLREMARVTRPGGAVAACVWDFGSGGSPLSLFWKAVRDLDPAAVDESHLPGTREGHLGDLLREAGLHDVEETSLVTALEHSSFEEWWDPFTLGVGPAGTYVAGLDERRREQLRKRCREALGPAPFVVTARAWAARGLVSG